MGSTDNGSAVPSAASGGAAGIDKGVDFANYFCTYAFLYYHKEMLSDRIRMDAYFNAIFQNRHHFRNKVVLDVGTGSGILAIWSAQAGVRKVYAVEATKMADHVRALVAANDVGEVVEVIEQSAIREEAGKVPFIGDKGPISDLADEYQSGSLILHPGGGRQDVLHWRQGTNLRFSRRVSVWKPHPTGEDKAARRAMFCPTTSTRRWKLFFPKLYVFLSRTYSGNLRQRRCLSYHFKYRTVHEDATKSWIC